MTSAVKVWLQRAVETLGAGIGFLAVTTQFFVSLPAFREKGMDTAGAIIHFFSFFTILTNIALVIFYLAARFEWNSRLALRLRAPEWQTAMALYITIVGFVYFAVLKDIWDPQGIFKVLDITLHYVAPMVFVLYWLFFVWHGQTTYRDAFTWLVPGLFYVIYALGRGIIIGLYPYPFIDIGMIGMTAVLRNVIFLLLFFFALGAIYVTFDGLLARLKK